MSTTRESTISESANNEIKINVDRLPSPPQVVVKILELDRDPESGVIELAKAVQSDPAISSHILKCCNSPLLGLSREVTSIQQAVAVIGMRGTKMMALSFSVLTSASETNDKQVQQFWVASVASALSFQRFVDKGGLQFEKDTAFVVGLLSRLAALGVELDQDSELNTRSLDQKLHDAGQPGLREYSAGVLRTWNFPESIIEVIESNDTLLSQFLDCANSIADTVVEGIQGSTGTETIQLFNELYNTIDPSGLPMYDEFVYDVINDWYDYLTTLGIDSPMVGDMSQVEQDKKAAMQRLIQELQEESAKAEAKAAEETAA